ncbi:hypothetical protein J5N97_013491 [Dioscorea zingiberensis]|uniref:Uncharacterized protein n=1 Tax=Dioscorea zingiberensis TaxID=325984 RepID=A0A9D5HJ55_9LILI|nr:hypothetical protein J5N97_013491 [Dioscorea zingiberensis]
MRYHRKLLIDLAATPPPETPKRQRFPSYLEAPNLSSETCLLCEILATTTISSIERALNDFGVRALSPADVKFVLKLSYAHTGPAVAFFRWAVPLLPRPHHHSPYSWNLIVDLLGKSLRFNTMWDTVRAMHNRLLLSHLRLNLLLLRRRPPPPQRP